MKDGLDGIFGLLISYTCRLNNTNEWQIITVLYYWVGSVLPAPHLDSRTCSKTVACFNNEYSHAKLLLKKTLDCVNIYIFSYEYL